jgi:hypothetical protein
MRLGLQIGGLWLAMIVLIGCSQSKELPTIVPTAVLPTPAPTHTQIPSVVPEPTPTVATLTPSPTPVIVEIQPTSMAGSGVNITSPRADETILQGHEAAVSGLVQLDAGETLSVTLIAAAGYTLAQADVKVNNFNSWQGAVAAPHSVGGQAAIHAAVIDREGNIVALDTVPVLLKVDQEGTDRYLALFRPAGDTLAVAGYHLFFDGLAQLPVDNLVSISVWDESCRNELARQSYRLRGSGYWQGFLPIPGNIVGPICAIAHFGTPGETGWREVQVPLTVLARTDKLAKGITIGNPPPARNLDPGKTLLFYGTAYNTPDNQILVSILLENGRLLTESMAIVDFFGYWEIELYIPGDAAGPALIEASFGERGIDDYISHEIPVTIGSSESTTEQSTEE